ncbi:unnamed protein product [Mytilus edulis]|uniref:Uncharacterized protein n=1 Tax=Mytilus edulis TaxID=6550 RepID=A0A8S3T745_MYTED|nr:unnamed protein product [Mytilus edulis]
MDGFKLYVTNTSTIPPDGYLCYEDPGPGLPSITQTIPCNQLGKYVIYYDDKGSFHVNRDIGPIVELCYVAINGCQKSFWGSDCQNNCAENCRQQNCFPGNGSCVWGCNPTNCLNDLCDKDTAVCTIGCKERRTGTYCNQYNIASYSLVSQYPSGGQPANRAKDGNKTTCSKTQGTSVVPLHYGYLCNTTCPPNCKGPCEIDVGDCLLGCTNGWTGNRCDTECHLGFYGNACLEPCSANCSNPKCNHVTGECIGGCKDGWQGFNCSQSSSGGKFVNNFSEFFDGCISRFCEHASGLCGNKTSCITGYRNGYSKEWIMPIHNRSRTTLRRNQDLYKTQFQKKDQRTITVLSASRLNVASVTKLSSIILLCLLKSNRLLEKDKGSVTVVSSNVIQNSLD